MIFVCDRCGHRYSVPDERVQGRTFRVTCKSCGNVILVRPGGTAGAEAKPPAPPSPQPPQLSTQPSRQEPPVTQEQPPVPTVQAARPELDPFADLSDPPPVPAAAPAPAPAPATAPFPPPTTRSVRDTGRGLTTAEMAWMSDEGDRSRAASDDAEVSVEVQEQAAPQAEEEQHIRRGPGVLRLTLVAALLGVVAAAAVGVFVWSPWATTPPPKPVVAVAPPPAPAKPPEPVPPPAPPAPPATAPVAVAPEPAVAPAPAQEPRPVPVAAAEKRPSRPPRPPRDEASPADEAPAPAASRPVGPGARFEPGTVVVGKARGKQQVKLPSKDRKLLDLLSRKEDEAAPPEPIEKLDLDSARSLEPGAVERVMSESQGAFSGCVTRTAKVAGLSGSVRRATLLLTVAGSGKVMSAWVAEAELSRTALGRCIAGAGRRLVFPAFEGDPVDVSVPLTLEAR